MKKIKLVLGLSLCACNIAFAQDIHFSQITESLTLLNPSQAGLGHDVRAVVNFKDQWRSVVSAPHQTINASADFALMQKLSGSHLGIGVSVFNDKSGDAKMATTMARAPEGEARTLELGVSFTGLPFVAERLMRLDSIYFMPVEWAGTMPGMNWATLASQARWRLRDLATGKDNHDIAWHFRRGGLLHLRLVGSRDVLHTMQHPIHLHGQRFVVLAVGGIPNHHLAWKDTVLVPAGGTVDLLVDLSNPGPWMLLCHIAEHLGAGMMTTILVEEN